MSGMRSLLDQPSQLRWMELTHENLVTNHTFRVADNHKTVLNVVVTPNRLAAEATILVDSTNVTRHSKLRKIVVSRTCNFDKNCDQLFNVVCVNLNLFVDG